MAVTAGGGRGNILSAREIVTKIVCQGRRRNNNCCCRSPRRARPKSVQHNLSSVRCARSHRPPNRACTRLLYDGTVAVWQPYRDAAAARDLVVASPGRRGRSIFARDHGAGGGAGRETRGLKRAAVLFVPPALVPVKCIMVPLCMTITSTTARHTGRAAASPRPVSTVPRTALYAHLYIGLRARQTSSTFSAHVIDYRVRRRCSKQ